MNTFLALVCAAAFSLNSLSIRLFQIKVMRSNRDIKIFQFLFCIVASFAYWIIDRFKFTLTLHDLLLATAFGILFSVCILSSAVCFVCGPMSVTSVIMNSSVVLPILFSCVILKEAVTASQIIGLVMLVSTFIILSSGSKDKNDITGRWFFLVLISFFSNGTTAIIQKVYKLSASGDGYDFMAVAYTVSAIVMLIAYILDKDKSSNKRHISPMPLFITLVLAAGLGSFGGNGLLLNLSTKMPASTLYPFVNGGLCVIVSIVSLLAFHEKATVRKLSAIICGTAAIIVLNL